MMDNQKRSKPLLLGWRPGRLARHSGLLLAWMLMRAGAQTAIVLLLARSLGATDYGQFVAIIAVASLVSPFVGMGLSNIVLRNGAKDPAHLSFYFRRALHWWLLTVLPGSMLACLLAVFLLPPGLPRLAAFSAISAELVTTSLTELCARHRQAEHRINAFGAINAGLPLARLVALFLLFILTDNHRTEHALWAYAVSSATYSLFLLLPMRIPHAAEEGIESMSARQGIPFSLANFAVRLQAEFNKPVLAQTSFGFAGSYNVAQRAVDMGSLPLAALQEALWPRLYAQKNPMPQLQRTGLLMMAIALIMCTSIWLAAPLLPVFLGESFSGAAIILRALAWLPLLQMFRALLNFHAIHHGRMQMIGWTYAIGAVISVICVAALVPSHGMTGAMLASYIAEAAMIAFLFGDALYTRHFLS